MVHLLMMVIIEPLRLIFDQLLMIGYSITNSSTISVLILSFLITVLLLPIYHSLLSRKKYYFIILEVFLLGFAGYYLPQTNLVRGVLTGFISYLYTYDRLGAYALFIIIHFFSLLVFKLLSGRKIFDCINKKLIKITRDESAISRTVFILCNVYLAISSGVMIPTYVMRTSPTEFMMEIGYKSTGNLILDCSLTAVGLFIVWIGLYYIISSSRTRYCLSVLASLFSILGTADYMFFGRKYGNMSSFMRYDVLPEISTKAIVINLIVMAFLLALVMVVWLHNTSIIRILCIIGVLESVCMSLMNTYAIFSLERDNKSIIESLENDTPVLEFDKKGNNVIIIVLDRAISFYLPFLLNENPELAENLCDFTYYPNTMSYGAYTNIGTMSIYGGYEYIPEEVNKRDNILLKDKQNEALKMLPVIFDENNYDVTVCDPPYANYDPVIPDLSIFDDYPSIHRYNMLTSSLTDAEKISNNRITISRNLLRYSLFRQAPVFLHTWSYDKGRYNDPDSHLPSYDGKYVEENATTSYGYIDDFINSYEVLQNLNNVTRFTDDGKNHLLIMYNQATHNPQMLQEPEYEPRLEVDNYDYEKNHPIRYDLNGKELKMDKSYQLSHYQTNMAVLVQVANWIKYLKQNDAYDNSRIIIVSDHGEDLGLAEYFMDNENSFDFALAEGMEDVNYKDLMLYNPLLMVKDFDDHGFSTNGDFMTNADTPILAMKGIIDNPVNPFTGNPVESVRKNDPEQHILYTEWNITINNGKTYLDGVDITLHNHYLFDRDNWTIND